MLKPDNLKTVPSSTRGILNRILLRERDLKPKIVSNVRMQVLQLLAIDGDKILKNMRGKLKNCMFMWRKNGDERMWRMCHELHADLAGVSLSRRGKLRNIPKGRGFRKIVDRSIQLVRSDLLDFLHVFAEHSNYRFDDFAAKVVDNQHFRDLVLNQVFDTAIQRERGYAAAMINELLADLDPEGAGDRALKLVDLHRSIQIRGRNVDQEAADIRSEFSRNRVWDDLEARDPVDKAAADITDHSVGRVRKRRVW